ncbi:MAG: adenylate/guanylate cyclase domain-containing protein [Magnetococcales bacterium]|nr:adenylate/guanylate cyclase domain-containing protein [Magnetococcales bacterium]
MERWRLFGGSILLLYLVTHLLNHTLGVLSVEAMEAGAEWLTEIWEFPPLLWLLLTAFTVHGTTALWGLFRRRSLRLPSWQLWQIGLGLLLPLLLMSHLTHGLILKNFTGFETSYSFVLLATWHLLPEQGLLLATAVVVVAVHGSIGFHQWQSHQPWYPRWRTPLLVLAFLLPSWALAGYVAAGGRGPSPTDQPDTAQRILEQTHLTPTLHHWGELGSRWGLIGYTGLLVALFGGRRIRLWRLMRGNTPKLFYRDNHILALLPGANVLETVLGAGIPHASICGGRGRCSVCRVRVGAGGDDLPPPGPQEARILSRLGAPDSVRLACQIHPRSDLEVTPQLPPSATAEDGYADSGSKQGVEAEILILFADLRGFTTFSEGKLPFDVVFVLNRYFKMVGQAVEASGGYLDKFIGDGVMALYGIRTDPTTAARQALDGARRIARGIDHLNESLGTELATPLRVGIGIHAGTVILGELGYGSARHLTALGDAVNTASRLEGSTKELDVQLVISDKVAQRAGMAMADYRTVDMTIRGRKQPLRVRAIPRAGELPDPDLPPPSTESRFPASLI